MRTTTTCNRNFLKEALESVSNQDYPNIKIILLEDQQNTRMASTVGDIVKNTINGNIEVIYMAEKCNGAAGASLKIRDKFIDEAKKEDVAILLDDDDQLTHNRAVSQIMTRMSATGAGVCMIGFSISNHLGLSIVADDTKLLYNKLLEEVESHNCAITSEQISDICRSASMGCTKCYRRRVLEDYITAIGKEEEEKEKENVRSKFIKLERYEDFPDFMTLLFKDVTITAINHSLYIYRQHASSITSNHHFEHFRTNRIGFLLLLKKVVDNNANLFNEHAKKEVENFIDFKLSVISRIIEKLNSETNTKMNYDEKNFITDYINQLNEIVNYTDIKLKEVNGKFDEITSEYLHKRS
ncbi:MAG: glycosyltransferase family A protein [Rikenellaceae bacterium]